MAPKCRPSGAGRRLAKGRAAARAFAIGRRVASRPEHTSCSPWTTASCHCALRRQRTPADLPAESRQPPTAIPGRKPSCPNGVPNRRTDSVRRFESEPAFDELQRERFLCRAFGRRVDDLSRQPIGWQTDWGIIVVTATLRLPGARTLRSLSMEHAASGRPRKKSPFHGLPGRDLDRVLVVGS